MAVLTQDEWIGLTVSLIGHFYSLYLVSVWTDKIFRVKFELSRKMIRSFFAPPGWAVQPILFCVSAFLTASLFLFWKDHYASSSDRNFALIMSFHFASVFLLQLWSTTASWGSRWWWFTVGDSVLLTATSTVVWAIMGVEKAWLPFGLYSPLPVVAFLSIGVSAGFAVDSALISEPALTAAWKRGNERIGDFFYMLSRAANASFQGDVAMKTRSKGSRAHTATAYAYQ